MARGTRSSDFPLPALDKNTNGDLDVAALTTDVRDGLRHAGLPGPRVTLRRVEALDRDPLTGKASRFIPLGLRIP